MDFLGATHLREDLSFLSVQHLTTVTSSVSRGGIPCPLPSPCCDLVCLRLVQILYMWLQPLQVHMYIYILCKNNNQRKRSYHPEGGERSLNWEVLKKKNEREKVT